MRDSDDDDDDDDLDMEGRRRGGGGGGVSYEEFTVYVYYLLPVIYQDYLKPFPVAYLTISSYAERSLNPSNLEPSIVLMSHFGCRARALPRNSPYINDLLEFSSISESTSSE